MIILFNYFTKKLATIYKTAHMQPILATQEQKP